MSTDGTQRHVAGSICLAIIAAAVTSVVVGITPAAACDPGQEARAHVAVVEREPSYSITALRACPDRYCASFGRRLLIFGMTANVATVAKICPAELAAICAEEVTTICARQAQPSERVTAAPASPQ
jgi:hypothetical protein